MGTTLTGKRVQNTYDSLIKISDNNNLSGVAKILGDGLGNDSPIYLSTSQIGIGITPAYQFHTSGNAKIGGNLIISGNLTVNGTLTYLNVTDLAVEDPLIKLAKDNTANTLDIGLFGKYVATGTKYKGLFNDASDDKFKLFIGTTVEPTTTVDISASGYTVGTLVANLEGNVTGGTISGTTGTFSGDVTTTNINLEGTTNPTIFFNGSSDVGVDMAIKATPEGLDFYEPEQENKVHFQILDDTGVNAVYGYKLNGTMVIDASRNLTNIGTGNFSGQVTIPETPTADAHAASKKYVDDQTIPTPTLSSVLSAGDSSGANDLKIIDDQKLLLGDDGDMQIYHNQVNSVFFNDTGNIVFRNNANDKDISFQTDDGLGYTTEYLRLDGDDVNVVFLKPVLSNEPINIYKFTNTSSSNDGSTLLSLTNNVGTNLTDGDLQQQKTFIDFNLLDANDNEYPQVRIGAEVGQNGNANTQILEGCGAFVVYTNNATGDGPGTPTGLAERFRVDYEGKATFTNHITTPELNLPSGGQVDWASGDARIVEGLVNNYSLSFQTFNGTAIDTALRLDGNNLATFASNINLASNKHILIGTDSGDAFNPSSAIRIQDSSHAYVQMKVGATNQGGVLIGDIDDDYVGGFIYSNSSNSLIFKTANVDALTINSSQNSTFAGTITASGYNDSNWNTAYTYSQVGHLPLAGGTVTGDILLSSTSPELQIVDTNSFTDPNDRWIVRGGANTLIMRWFDWSAGTNTDVLTLSPTSITFNGTIGSTLNIAGTGDGLFIKQTTNAGFASIKFSDDTNDTQFGYIKYTHADSQSRGGGSSLWLLGQNDHTVVVGDGTNTGRIIVSTQNSVNEVDYGFYLDLNTGMYQPADNQIGLVSNGSRKLLVGTGGVIIENGYLRTSGGTVGSPGLQIGDTDTGFYDSGSNAVSFSSGGVQKIAFNNDSAVFVYGASFGGNVTVNNMLTVNIDDISTGENRGLRIINTSGVDQQWNITTGVTGVENESFCIRDATGNVNALKLAISTGNASFANNITTGSIINADIPLSINKSKGGNVAIGFLRNSASSGGNGLVVDVTNTPGDYIADFRIGNSSKVKINNQGNLGIGIDPVYRLHAYHPTGNVVARFESGDPNVWIDLHDNNSSTYGVLLGAEGTDFIIAPNNTQVVRVKQNGRVGINTDDPDYVLDIIGTSPRIRVQENSSNTAITMVEVENSDGRGAMLGVGGSGRTDILSNTGFINAQSELNGLAIGTEGADPILFYNNGVATSNEKMRLTSSGLLGIGTGASVGADIHIKRAGDASIIIEADSDNVGENDNPTLFLRQDGAIITSRYGINGDANNQFTGAIGNAAYIHSMGAFQIAPDNGLISATFKDGAVLIDGTAGEVPAYKLDIRNAGSSGINISGTGAYLRWNSGDMQIKNAGGYKMEFDTWNGSSLTEKMSISGGGTVHANTRVDIGTQTWTGYGSNPIAKLNVEVSNSNAINIFNVSEGFAYLNFIDSQSNNTQRAEIAFSSGSGNPFKIVNMGNTALYITDQGNIGVKKTSGISYAFDVTGTIRATSDVIAFSDRRVKKDIVTVDNALNKVINLRGVTYKRKDTPDNKTKLGVIAQEVLEVLPEVVEKDDKGLYSVAYGNMAGVFIEAIKELKAEVDSLKQEIKQLKK